MKVRLDRNGELWLSNYRSKNITNLRKQLIKYSPQKTYQITFILSLKAASMNFIFVFYFERMKINIMNKNV